jgi:hypothetical protein
MRRFLNSRIALLFTAVLLVFICSGCEPKLEAKMNKLISTAKTSVNPTNLQLWAMEVLKTNPQLYSSVSEQKLPLDVYSLRSREVQLKPDILESNCVYLVCAKTYKFLGSSCDGFWGICVGPPNFKPTQDIRFGGTYYTNWIPGVYFWYDKVMM